MLVGNEVSVSACFIPYWDTEITTFKDARSQTRVDVTCGTKRCHNSDTKQVLEISVQLGPETCIGSLYYSLVNTEDTPMPCIIGGGLLGGSTHEATRVAFDTNPDLVHRLDLTFTVLCNPQEVLDFWIHVKQEFTVKGMWFAFANACASWLECAAALLIRDGTAKTSTLYVVTHDLLAYANKYLHHYNVVVQRDGALEDWVKCVDSKAFGDILPLQNSAVSEYLTCVAAVVRFPLAWWHDSPHHREDITAMYSAEFVIKVCNKLVFEKPWDQ